MSEISTSEAAKRLGVSSRQVVNLIHRGSLTARPKSDATRSHWLVEEVSVTAYLERMKNLRK